MFPSCIVAVIYGEKDGWAILAAVLLCLLFWRSFTHWIGGMGVLVFLLTLLPLAGGSHMNLMKAESPGPSVSRLVPKVKSTAKILYLIYIVMTVTEIILLLIGKMPLFDALTLSFGTAGTGGFGIRNDSIAGYSVYCQVVITIFMILFGVNFNVYFLLLLKKFRQASVNEEVRAYLLIILSAILVITWNIRRMFDSIGKAVEHEVVRSTNVFMGIYVPVFAFSILLIAFDNLDLATNFTAVTATLNNIGPGLELVGPTGNFSVFSDFSKLVLTFDMLAGRLELFPLLLLFVPDTWKKF